MELTHNQEYAKSRAESLLARRASEAEATEKRDTDAVAIQKVGPLQFEKLRNTLKEIVEGFNSYLANPELNYSEGTHLAAITAKPGKIIFTYDPTTSSLTVKGLKSVTVYQLTLDNATANFCVPPSGTTVSVSSIAGSATDEIVAAL